MTEVWMSEPAVDPVIEVQRADWSFTGVNEDAEDARFYTALQADVAREIARAFRGGGQVWVGRELRMRVGPYTIHARVASVEPPRATVIGERTQIFARYRERPKEQTQDIASFIAEVIRYPAQREFQAMYDSLVGLDEIKRDLLLKLRLLLDPERIGAWMRAHYREREPYALLQTLRDRYPLVILEGEVGSGKTALARSIGYPLSEELRRPVTLYVMNAQVRGGGHVGELSLNIARAFTEAERAWERERLPVLLLIDEADALAQARGGRQRHIEDDAGVNTLIQRIDRLRGKPMAVLFATNLVQTLDSALLRRAIGSYTFDRPTAEQRAQALRRLLAPLGIGDQHIAELAEQTRPRPVRGFTTIPQRYTYSDLTQRLVPAAVEEALARDQPLTFEALLSACARIDPTPESSAARDSLAGEGR
jgi:SpoVK/Ycf46/Vps4 family AAA+-type ATPase